MATKTRESVRLDFRFTPEQKELIQQAASVNNLSTTAFARDVLLTKAREVLKTATVTELSSRDRDIFQTMLAEDAEPNEVLRAAADRYRQGGY